MQYNCGPLFSPEIIHSLPYVIQYNGVCFKYVNGRYLESRLDGPEAYFTELYLSLPYELDAHKFAQDTLLSCQNSKKHKHQIGKIAEMWQPRYAIIPRGSMPQELEKVFRRIDSTAFPQE